MPLHIIDLIAFDFDINLSFDLIPNGTTRTLSPGTSSSSFAGRAPENGPVSPYRLLPPEPFNLFSLLSPCLPSSYSMVSLYSAP